MTVRELAILFWAISLLAAPAFGAEETAPAKAKSDEYKMTNMSEPGAARITKLPDETVVGRPTEAVAAPAPEAVPAESVGEYGVSEVNFLKLPTNPVETPASVQVLTPELMADQDSFRLKDALRNVAGVAPQLTEAYGQEYETMSVRGFTQRLFRSGLRTYGTDTVDLATVERVEVIKGPDSVTFGDNEPGGIINVVTKGASLTPQRFKVQASGGSYDDYRASVDMGGALSNDYGLAYRFNFSYINKDSFRNYVDKESYAFAPAFLWQIGETTTLDLRTSYKHEERMLDPGVVFDANNHPVAALDTFLGEPDADGLTLDDSLIDLTLTHEFSSWLSLRSHLVHHDFENDMEAVRLTGKVDAANRIARYYDASDIRIKETSLNTDLLFNFEGENYSNHLVLGNELRHRSKNWHQMRDSTTLGKISIIDPVYTLDESKLKIVDGGDDDYELDCFSLYAQDTLALLDDKLHLMFGGRFDDVESRDISTSNVKNKGESDATTGQVGVLYKLLPNLYPYLTYSTSFNPPSSSNVDVNGNYLEPETGEQIEAGFKSPFFNEKLVITNSLYQIDKENVSIGDPDNPGYKLNGGELRSRGYEFTAQGQITANWSVYASYAYTDTEVVKSDSLPEGSRFRGIPLNSGSLWVVHTQREGALSGLRLGAGLFAADSQLGDNAGSFELPGYATVDLMAGYKRELAENRVFTTQLNLHNVLDREYYESSSSSTAVMPGAPLTATLTVGFEF